MSRAGPVLCALVVCAGVAVPMRPALAQCPDGSPPPCAGARPTAPGANSVAVLYFDTRDTTDRYLTDGLTEEIILRLQQLPRLEVKSRYESQRVRRIGATPAALGRTLGVRYLVNGTVQRAGERVVVRVELTRADRAVGIWSERFDQTSGNVLDVIDTIARGVATGVAGRLLPAEASDLARRPTADPVAYEQFLRGNFYLAQRTAAGLARAVEAYETATARDPAFKPARARAAYAYAVGIFYGVGDQPRDSTVARASRATEHAMRDAPELSDTWLARGWYLVITTLLGSNSDMPGARAALERAVQLDPSSPEAHSQFGSVLAILAEDSLAESELLRALALEPGRAVTFVDLTSLAIYRNRFAEAARWGDSAIAADPRFVRAYALRALARLALGDTTGAMADAARGIGLGADATIVALSAHAVVLAAIGDTAAARVEAETAARASTSSTAMPFVALGDRRRALDVLEAMPARGMRCLASRFPIVAALRGDPRFDRLTADCPWRR